MSKSLRHSGPHFDGFDFEAAEETERSIKTSTHHLVATSRLTLQDLVIDTSQETDELSGHTSTSRTPKVFLNKTKVSRDRINELMSISETELEKPSSKSFFSFFFDD